MTVNRVLLYLNRVSKQESRYEQAVHWREQAQSTVDRIEAIVGEDPLRWWIPSAATMADDKDSFSMHVWNGGFKLNIYDFDLDSVSAMLVEALRELASECVDTADKIEFLAADGGAA